MKVSSVLSCPGVPKVSRNSMDPWLLGISAVNVCMSMEMK